MTVRIHPNGVLCLPRRIILAFIGNLGDSLVQKRFEWRRKIQHIEHRSSERGKEEAAFAGSLASVRCGRFLELKPRGDLYDPGRICSRDLAKCSCVNSCQLEVVLEIYIVE